MEDPMPERRGFTRVALSVAATLKARDDIAVGLVENISLNGLCMQLQNEIILEADELVTADLYLNESDQCQSILRLHGRVARMDEKGVGAQFRQMSLTNHTRLIKIISFVGDTYRMDAACLQIGHLIG